MTLVTVGADVGRDGVGRRGRWPGAGGVGRRHGEGVAVPLVSPVTVVEVPVVLRTVGRLRGRP